MSDEVNLSSFLSDSTIEPDGAEAIAEHRRRYPGAYSSGQPTPFQKSALSAVEVSVADPLYNAREPFVPIQHEQPHHRHMIDLRSQGYTVKEIAELTGFSSICVSNILRQPWAQERLTSGVNTIRDAVVASMTEETMKSWKTLLAIRDDPEAPAHVRKGVCEGHLDRIFGKATQPLAVYDGVDFDKLSDADLAKHLPATLRTATQPPPVAT